MTKQEIKEKQGFQEKAHCCGDCLYFTSEMKEYQSLWTHKPWVHEVNQRCSKGKFKVKKRNWCKMHITKN